MDDTMTLEELRDAVRVHTVRNRAGTIRCPQWAHDADAAVDAAIRERDRLRRTNARLLECIKSEMATNAPRRIRAAGAHALLVAVLCDRSGRACVGGSDKDRAIIDSALRMLVENDDV